MSKKYIVILGDGMADYPDENGQTPLTLSLKPTIDALAKKSEIALCQTIPEGMKPGSDTANLSVMGYDPKKYYTGRSPLEAISIGIKLNDTDVTYRCNLVTLSSDENYADKIMLDYSAGEISTDESRALIEYLAEKLPLSGLKLYSGVSYRHCLVREMGKLGADLTPPHDISDKAICTFLPYGEYADEFLELMETSYKLLSNHPINKQREMKNLNPANSIWLWGEGKMPLLDDFKTKFGLRGAVISAVDLIKGIGLGSNMKSINVEGATGNLNTNFAGKAQAAIKALDTCDFVYLHIEAPDECGHHGDKQGKIKAIELIDSQVVKPILKHLENNNIPFKMMILPDHLTPIVKKTHTSEPVPYLLYDSENIAVGEKSYDEFTAQNSKLLVPQGYMLMEKLISK